MADIFQNLSEVWQRAGLFRRTVLVLLLLVCIGSAVVAVNWARKPHLALLYSGLAPAEAAKIYEKVRDAKVASELRDGGSTIYVDEKQVYAMRLTMAGQGLPTGEQAGYSILDVKSFGSSPGEQQFKFKRAIEGELAKSIELIDGVTFARVLVAKPSAKLFAANNQQATASITLKLRAGRRMSSSNVSAIVNLVAGAVEGLEAKNVQVIDAAGPTLLTGGGQDEGAKIANTMHEYQRQVENDLARKAEDLLLPVLGPGKAIVRVSATIDRTTSRTTAEVWGEALKRREETVNKSKTPAGAVGADKDAKIKPDTEETITTENDYPKSLEEKSTPPGEVIDIQVAAMVDLSGSSDPNDPAAASAVTLTIDDVKTIIQKALGLKDASAIAVQEASFYQPPVEPELPEPGMFSVDNIMKYLQQISLGLLVLGALLVLKMFGSKKISKIELAAVLEGQPAEAENLLPASGVGMTSDALRTRITHALQENPEEVKRLFLSWAESEKGEV